MTQQRKNNDLPGEVFTFFSTASATGKTVLAVNFAAYLADRGFKVCLVDVDLQFGDVSNYLKLDSEKTIYDYSAAKEDGNPISIASCLTPTEFGFSVLARPRELDEAYIIESEIVQSALNELRADFDYLIIDTTTGFSEINLGILEQTDAMFLPCVVDFIPSIKNLKIGLDTLQSLQFDLNRVRMILNRNNAETQISVKDVEALLGSSFQYLVGNDYMGVMNSVKQGKPIVLSDTSSHVADDITQIVASELGEQEEKSGLSKWLGSLWN